MANSSDVSNLLDLCRNRIIRFTASKHKNTEKKNAELQKGTLREGCTVAAVLVPLFLKEGIVHVLLTLRSQLVSTHKGQVAFPGGKQDDGDKDIVTTALREAKEEIGLPPEIVDTIAVMEPVPIRLTNGNLHVFPVVGLLKSNFEMVLNRSEVEATFSVPLEFFLLKTSHRYVKGTYKNFNYRVHCFDFESAEKGSTLSEPLKFLIWGFTAFVCVKVASITLNKLPEYDLEADTELRRYLENSDAEESSFNVNSRL